MVAARRREASGDEVGEKRPGPGASAPLSRGARRARGRSTFTTWPQPGNVWTPKRLMMLSVPHRGQAMVTRPTVVLETTTGVLIAGASFLPRPNYVPCPNPSDTCLAGTPIFRPVTLVPIWAIHPRTYVASSLVWASVAARSRAAPARGETRGWGRSRDSRHQGIHASGRFRHAGRRQVGVALCEVVLPRPRISSSSSICSRVIVGSCSPGRSGSMRTICSQR